MTDAQTIREKTGTYPNELIMRYFAYLRQVGCYMDIERIELTVIPADGSQHVTRMVSSPGKVEITSACRTSDPADMQSPGKARNDL